MLIVAASAAWAVGQALLLSACLYCKGPDGSWTEVSTRHGAHDGYEVFTCTPGEIVIHVQGSGSDWFGKVAPLDPNRGQALETLATRIASTLPGSSVDGRVSQGQGCRNEQAIRVLLSDWRRVDEAIEDVGALMRYDNLREEVTIEVTRLCEEGE